MTGDETETEASGEETPEEVVTEGERDVTSLGGGTHVRGTRKVVELSQVAKPLAKIERTIALVHSIDGEFSAAKFSALLKATDPTLYERHEDGRPATAAWHHTDPEDPNYCSTVFNSYREYPIPEWHHRQWVGPSVLASRGGVRVASGKYLGEDGAWYLFRGGPAPPTPPYWIPEEERPGRKR